ncbi:hypothetical protein GDO86_020050 [Hymenochirus boettgeri]|uniref:Sulfotransferase n=1 Tax=Hymenochirus boettgeri TaxID=247094 RepID=A0A8T2IFG5_9PIPI|nr:hypothetical protein GDO86_020050 [Hymenochirus boettgeri]KAG8430752.1 hypothetical protein GDO86_020050 [Hymenochirus boettgeri]
MSQDKDYNQAILEAPEDLFYRFPLSLVHGVPLMKPIANNWEKIENFLARPDDLLIATYPKAGTTWMQEIVDFIIHDGDLDQANCAPTYVRSPFLEISSPPPIPSGVDVLETTPSPRMIKTHLQYKLVPKSFWEKNCKVIYVARNPKDIAVSYYFFDLMKQTQPDPGTWEEMWTILGWGSWFDHVINWWEAKDKHQILYMFYEDMKEDPKREIYKVMKYLGKKLPGEVVEKICQHTTFKAMKENPMTNYSSMPSAVMDHSISPFIRKGEVADWKNHFTEKQSKRFDAEYEKRMEGTDLKFRCTI